MGSKAAKFASAMVAGILAGAPLSAPDRAANAAECQTEPGQTAVKGQHWHYRIESGTKRHCWYLRDEGEKTTRNAPVADSAPPAAPKSASQNSEAAPRSLADARAEFPAPLPTTANGTAAPAPAVTSPAPAPTVRAATPSEADAAAGSAIDSRWPSPSDAAAPPTVAPPPPPPAQAADPQPADPEPVAQDAVAAKPVAAQPAAPTAAAAERPALSLQMLFAVILGALALAGITASIVVRLGRARHVRLDANRRAAIWHRIDDAAEPDDAPASTPPWVEPAIAQAPLRAEAPRPRKPAPAVATQERYQKIEEILAQIVKQVQQNDAEAVAPDAHLSS